MRTYTFREAEESFRKYPYYIYPAVSALKGATAAERKILVRRIATVIGDEPSLRAVIGMDPEEFDCFYPDMRKPELSTEDTISSFFSHFSPDTPATDEDVERIIAAPAIDYAAQMLDDADDPEEPLPEDAGEGDGQDATSSAIDAFLAAVPPKTPTRKKRVKEEAPLSEALAAVMVKNRNYRKALEIITELSLNNPKKSIYFADQMRFLKKLIKNQENS